jgi:lysophospholipase L1-like esterase
MKKRFIFLAVFLLVVSVLTMGLATTRAYASDDDDDNVSNVIWQGLWQGSHFDASLDDEDETPPTNTHYRKHEYKTKTQHKEYEHKTEPHKTDEEHSSDYTSHQDYPKHTTNHHRPTQQHTIKNQASVQPPSTNMPTYAALGDSVAAGFGLSDDQTRCGRSDNAYPVVIANTRHLSLIHAACTGATAGDLFTKQRKGGPNLAPQIDTAFAHGTPQLITITAGANDAHWVQFARKCYRSTCGTERDTRIADGLLAALRVKLDYTFSEIARRSGDQPPKVIITGYYNPLSAECSTIEPRLTPNEITWLSNRIELLNQTIKDVSNEYSFVMYAPVSFGGHDICADNPWVQGLQDPAPFHPNAQGQAAIARAILAAQN